MLDKIVDQMHWAGGQAIDWLLANPSADPSFLKLTAHILNAQAVWLDRVFERPDSREPWSALALADLAPLNERNHRAFREALKGEVKKEVDYKLRDGSPSRSSVEDMILHAWSHNFHHLGQMSARASALGLKYPNLAYIHYTRAVRG